MGEGGRFVGRGGEMGGGRGETGGGAGDTLRVRRGRMGEGGGEKEYWEETGVEGRGGGGEGEGEGGAE